jgi:hypothetical protein
MKESELRQFLLEFAKVTRDMAENRSSRFSADTPLLREMIKGSVNIYGVVTEVRTSSKVPKISVAITNHWAWKEGSKYDDYITNVFIPPEACTAFIWRLKILLGQNNKAVSK